MQPTFARPPSFLVLLVIAYLGFISLGLPDGVLGVAWTSIRTTFGLPQSGLGAVLMGAGVGYFVSSFLSGRLLRWLGVGNLLAISSALITLSLVGYAIAPSWYAFIACAPVAGLGSGAIDAGLNAYAASHFSPKHINWLHACYGVGATLGPLIMTGVLARGLAWRWGYGAVGILLLCMTLVFSLTRGYWQQNRPSAHSPSSPPVKLLATLQRPLVWLQMMTFFAYTGFEVTAGQWSFTFYTEARSIALDTAGVWVGLYWGSLTLGRFLFGFIVPQLGTTRLLRLSTLSALMGSVLFILGQPTWMSVMGLALIGLSLAPVFPCLMAETPRRLGRDAANAIGFQVSAAMLGSVTVPGITGVLVTRFSLEMIGVVVVVVAVVLWSLHEALLRFAIAAKPG